MRFYQKIGLEREKERVRKPQLRDKTEQEVPGLAPHGEGGG